MICRVKANDDFLSRIFIVRRIGVTLVSDNHLGSRCTILQGAVCVLCCVLTAQGQMSFCHRVLDPSPSPTLPPAPSGHH